MVLGIQNMQASSQSDQSGPSKSVCLAVPLGQLCGNGMSMANKQDLCYVGYKYIGTKIEGRSTAPFPRKIAEKMIAEADRYFAGVATHWLIPQETPIKKEHKNEMER